jgi:hypothetical protein
VPARLSSPIPAVAHATAPVAMAPGQCRSLLADLAHITDPRHRRGRRHLLAGVLAVAVCAVLAGARSLAAIGASRAREQTLRHAAEALTGRARCGHAVCGLVDGLTTTLRDLLRRGRGRVGYLLEGLDRHPALPAAARPAPQPAAVRVLSHDLEDLARLGGELCRVVRRPHDGRAGRLGQVPCWNPARAVLGDNEHERGPLSVTVAGVNFLPNAQPQGGPIRDLVRRPRPHSLHDSILSVARTTVPVVESGLPIMPRYPTRA